VELALLVARIVLLVKSLSRCTRMGRSQSIDRTCGPAPCKLYNNTGGTRESTDEAKAKAKAEVPFLAWVLASALAPSLVGEMEFQICPPR
jgi:hypothetical protein